VKLDVLALAVEQQQEGVVHLGLAARVRLGDRAAVEEHHEAPGPPVTPGLLVHVELSGWNQTMSPSSLSPPCPASPAKNRRRRKTG